MRIITLCFSFLLTAMPAMAFTDPDHPELERILAKYEGKQIPRSCSTLQESEFTRIASLEKFESALILKTLKNNGCEIRFLAVGGRDFVTRDLELYEKILAEPNAASATDLHTHPVLNVDYFREGNPYKGEIMFASTAAIRAAQLPPDLFDKLLDSTREGKAPGFNLSPPSAQDMLAATAESKLPLNYAVLTSAGIWRYKINRSKPLDQIRHRFEDFNVFSFMYEIANSENPGTKPAQKDRARKLFDENMKDPENLRIYLEWQACSLGLRKPFSKAAVEALLQGDRSKTDAEFAEKIALARRWGALLGEIGIELEFTPFSRR